MLEVPGGCQELSKYFTLHRRRTQGLDASSVYGVLVQSLWFVEQPRGKADYADIKAGPSKGIFFCFCSSIHILNYWSSTTKDKRTAHVNTAARVITFLRPYIFAPAGLYRVVRGQ